MAAALQAQRLFLTASTSSSTSSSWTARRPRRSSATPCRAALRVPGGLQTAASPADLSLKLDWIDVRVTTAAARDGTVVEKLLLVAEAAADRAEMHDIIGRQRDNWNHLLLHSTNSLTPVRAGIELRTTTPVTEADVQEAMERVLALDAAYPLPLLPGMLEKFPKAVEPARWWPRRRPQQLKRRSKSFGRRGAGKTNNNGWTQELEEEMRGLLRVLRAKDEHQYLTVGELAQLEPKLAQLAGAGNPGVVQVHAVYEDEAWTHMVMDLCTGPDLLDWVGLRRDALVPEPVAAAIVAQALALCHRRGVAHRDVKPDNILVDAAVDEEDGEAEAEGEAAPRARLADFECQDEDDRVRKMEGSFYNLLPCWHRHVDKDVYGPK